PEGVYCFWVTREVDEPSEDLDFPEAAELKFKRESWNLGLSEETQEQLDDELRRYPEVHYVLVIGNSPDRDYVAEYLTTKFPGKVQVDSAVGWEDTDMFRALDAKFYELIGADVKVTAKPRSVGAAVKKSKRPKASKKCCNAIRPGWRSPQRS
ncbi:MAG: hypothetical protein JNL96_25585, partial [Planctomycetaceae bacterium]|nr:hypothetical protein [Planctomycetaceae bacterium]